MQFQKYVDTAVELMLREGPKIILALFVLFIGLRVIKTVHKLISKVFEKSKMDPTLQSFTNGLIDWGFKILLFISVASMIGIETTSFIAVLGAAGLAVGMSLQGTLSNFAGGVLILALRPYKVGDWIDAQGEFGGVQEIGIFNTVLVTIDSKTVIIPNGAIMNGNIINVSSKGMIRVSGVISISYDSDLKKAKEVLLEMLSDNELILPDPQPYIGVSALVDSAVNLVMHVHCLPEHYWDVYYQILENAKLALDKNKIKIPFPQMDVHFDKEIKL